MDQNQLITMTKKEAKRYEIIKNLGSPSTSVIV